MSKTASAYGRFRRARLAYNPVPGDLKSGIPADVEIPAPVYRLSAIFLQNVYNLIYHYRGIGALLNKKLKNDNKIDLPVQLPFLPCHS